jgi:N-acetylmuramate 1-kinase
MSMTPEQEALLIFTRHQFPALADAPCEVQAILKGGSDRRFYRLNWGARHPPMVLMVYTMARRDNPKFVPATHRLAALDVHVPRVFAFDEERLCVWLEDLGCMDLHSLRDRPWAERMAGYQATLREAAKIHSVRDERLSDADREELEPPFDETLYDWEQNYFLDHFVKGHLNRDFLAADFAPAHAALKELRKKLASLPRCLVHRDFQSQNVLLRDGSAWLVDYQGLRPGLAEYDLASLLYDPYVTLSEAEREELLHHYAALRHLPYDSLHETFHLCAAQRLMQALGAYANLSRNLGKPHFKEHIPAAVENLTLVCNSSPLLKPLLPLFLTV